MLIHPNRKIVEDIQLLFQDLYLNIHTALSASDTIRNIQCGLFASIVFSPVPLPVPGRPDVLVPPLPAALPVEALFPFAAAPAAPVFACPPFLPPAPAPPPAAPSAFVADGCRLKTIYLLIVEILEIRE